MIRSYNNDKTIVYAWAKFYPKVRDKHRSKGDFGVETSDGRHFEHYYYSHNGMHQLKEVTSDEKPKETMHYVTYKQKNLLKAITWPQGRSLDINYYLPGDLNNKEKVKKDDEVCFRVKELMAPLKENGEKVVTHRFTYDLKHRKTTVVDAEGASTVYSWNKDLRLTQIDRFARSGILYNRIRFVWGKNGTKDETNLICKILFDEKEKPIQATHYHYDKYGNVVEENLIGNLTGEGSAFTLDGEGLPEEVSAEVYTKKFTYSHDGRHLLYSVQEDNGLKIEYAYLKHTNLIKEERHYDRDVLFWHKIYQYDDNRNLIKETVQDLQGRAHLVTTIGLKSSAEVFAGMPEVISEMAGDTLLKKTILHYTTGGKIERKEIYDATGSPCYDLKYVYRKGLLKEETNALGYTAFTTYDELRNKETYKDFGQRSKVVMSYDRLNRPKRSVEYGDDRVKECSWAYNLLHQKIEFWDEYKKTTQYKYDSFGHLIETHLPGGGVELSTYDSSGCLIAYTDAMGNTVQTSYNIYKKPVSIQYPDGSKESFVYYKDGTLKSHMDQNGMETLYTYDAFRRVLSKATPYTVESFTYDSFNLLTKTDAEGHTTSYEYDKAGRKIKELFEEDSITYEYDVLGRPYKETHGELVSVTMYDYLNRPTEERKEDLYGNWLQKISYGYDAAGNKTTTTLYVENKESQEILEYDAFRRVVKKTDPLGFATTYAYEWVPHRNTTVDPLGLQVIETFNAQNKLFSLEKRSSKKETLLLDLYDYDFNGNMYRKESSFEGVEQLIFREYDSMNRVKTLIEGADTSEQKVSHYTYSPKGLLATITKPSGVVLTSTYDELDNLKFQRSSDGSISYSYDYDKTGHLLEALNENTEESLVRSYTAKGNLAKETFPSGLMVKSSYDSQGRRKSCLLPDGSSLLYDYNALHLKSVSRVKNNVHQYTHSYKAHDLSGRVLIEERPLQTGMITRGYDQLGRQVSIKTPDFHQEALSFDPVGNLLASSRQDEHLTFAYDDLYQLIEEKDHVYSFDAKHNRLKKGADLFTANALNQTSELEYDADGNPKFLEEKKLSYDALDRLVSVEEEGLRTQYGYDALHRRLSKKTYALIGNSWTLTKEIFYLYDGQNEIGSYDREGTLLEFRVLGNTSSAEIGSAVAIEIGDQLYIPSHDLHGNVASLYSPVNRSFEEYSYTAFGEEKFSFSPINPWRFSSKRTDEETGLVYYGRRYYAPKIGRFLTPDPLGLEAGPNQYAFVLNAPLTHFDLYGLLDESSNFSNNAMQAGVGVAHAIGGSCISAAVGVSDLAYVGVGLPLYGAALLMQSESMANYFSPSSHAREMSSMRSSSEAFMQRVLPSDRDSNVYQNTRMGTEMTADALLITYAVGGLALRAGAKVVAWGASKFGRVSSRAIQTEVFASVQEGEIAGGAYNCAVFEDYKILLRSQMEKPYVTNLELEKMLNSNYKSGACVGNGSTAAAIRSELSTGEQVFDRWHSQKGINSISFFENWLKRNPTASAGDRAAAENMIKDLSNALGE